MSRNAFAAFKPSIAVSSLAVLAVVGSCGRANAPVESASRVQEA